MPRRIADLVIEAVPEQLELKRDIYERLGAVAPEKTIFANQLVDPAAEQADGCTGRPDRFLALHFANEIWKFNVGEVMGTELTSPAAYDTVVEFAGDIGMVPIEIKKEKAGYVLNSLLVPFLNAAGELLVDGIADPETIDKTWRIATGAPSGPFQIYDVIGLMTPYNVAMADPRAKSQAFAKLLKRSTSTRGSSGWRRGRGSTRTRSGIDTRPFTLFSLIVRALSANVVASRDDEHDRMDGREWQ